jgi:hypothetical protein
MTTGGMLEALMTSSAVRDVRAEGSRKWNKQREESKKQLKR